MSAEPKELSELQARLGVPVDDQILEQALTHRSYAYEHGGLPTNERLEFLGDAVLGLVVTDSLYRRHPDLSEGQLAKLRAAVVNMRALADVGRSLNLGAFLKLGRGEESTGGRDKASILADTIEALIGAVYVDRGIDVATDLVHRLVDDLIDMSATLGAGLDWKTSLQEFTSRHSLGVPEYHVSEEGPDHEKTFTAQVILRDEVYGTGQGRSKKEAEANAAELAWSALNEKLGDAMIDEVAAEHEGASNGDGAGTGADGVDGTEVRTDRADGTGVGADGADHSADASTRRA
ncbi:ribonuclease III [Actinobacteria bacterium YIM 96077]|uniref:Ribonuclease 3 n=1 Tax=Phytoactinopolyspora halophila TaxID=1981511 RepID=A0A329QF73_9ACTN|nr:ribonuclease III [Phytoactinopolyspora halophila]AYY12707.1 ribonuclease III [Actinobacteria bacterium YIM 96077]RAW10621.1 ribonuclease III [Phytoactinopolyspora halophila]